MSSTQIFRTVSEWKEQKKKLTGKTLGFVPTMGALHEGHRSLIERARKENNHVAVSIFVNPTQFNDPNDLKNYPKDFDKDLNFLKEAGVDFLFYPDFGELYPDRYRYKIVETDFSYELCGASRPGHFDGVLTVVMKLLQIIRPDRSYFGEKDYQQYLLVKKMAEAFFLDSEIISCPTVRTEDGLALSSRNQLLTAKDYGLAVHFPEFLKTAANSDEAAEKLEEFGLDVDYVVDRGGRRFGAVRVGKVRLIDNIELRR